MTLPIVVAGGGLAGAAASCLLARAGRHVVVFERDAAAADKICGEFISIEARTYLERIGLGLTELGAHPIQEFRLARGHAVVSCALPFTGLGLSRRVVDEALLNHAARCGAEVRRGHAVKLLRDRDPIVLEVAATRYGRRGCSWPPASTISAVCGETRPRCRTLWGSNSIVG